MKIETLDDWNLVLTGCDCCPMPACPAPLMECESITAPICGFDLPPHPDIPVSDCPPRFASRATTYSLNRSKETVYEGYGTETDEETVSSNALVQTTLEKTAPGVFACEEQYWQTVEQSSSYHRIVRPGNALEEIGSYSQTDVSTPGNTPFLVGPIGGPYSSSIAGTYTSSSTQQYPPDPAETYSDSGAGAAHFYDPILNGPAIDASWNFTAPGTFTKTIPITEDGTGEVVWTVVYSSPAHHDFSELDYTEDGDEEPSCIAVRGCDQATKARRQFRVPTSHPGSYYKVTFDVIEEPDGWEESETELRSFYATDITRVWTTGPGSGAQDDPSWNLGEPYEIPPPSVPGRRRIVNIRYECYRSAKFGTKPQVMGESVELPAP
jgi:hypothetical protein